VPDEATIDITVMEKVLFVMKGGEVIKNLQ
jgi:hypothetical protein